eukprot:12914965-Prorocentrum_lima.AAC.1
MWTLPGLLKPLVEGNLWDTTCQLQSDNGGEFINEPLIEGCNERGGCMTQISPCQPRSNGLSSIGLSKRI